MTRTRTLAELKRRIAPGVRLAVVDHWIERYRGTERMVTHAGATQFRFVTCGEVPAKEHYSPHPAAASLTWLDDDTFRVETGETSSGVARFWTLRFF